jgi:hypothetical protein
LRFRSGPLVGYRFGGKEISVAAEADPERVDGPVHVAACPGAADGAPGEAMQGLAPTDRLGAWNADSFVPAADRSSADVNPRALEAIFASDASPVPARELAADLTADPLKPFTAPVDLASARFCRAGEGSAATLADQAVLTTLRLRTPGRAHVYEAMALEGGNAPLVSFAGAPVAASTPELE